jgi:hypothetical protein
METITKTDYRYIIEGLELLHAKELREYEKMKHKLWAKGQFKSSKIRYIYELVELIKRGLK